MTLVVYVKKGCPYCEKVIRYAEKNSDKKVEIYTADKDFKTSTFKEKYGNNATFPRGYLVKGKDVKLVGGSDAIIRELEKN